MPSKLTHRLVLKALVAISAARASAGAPGALHSWFSIGFAGRSVEARLPGSGDSSEHAMGMLESGTPGETSLEDPVPPPSQGLPPQGETQLPSPPDPAVPPTGPLPARFSHLVHAGCPRSHVCAHGEAFIKN